MLEIYVPNSTEGSELCHPRQEKDFETFCVQINGEARSLTWHKMSVNLIHEDEGKKLSTSDSPWLGAHALIFRRSAIDKIGDILHEYGELLPLECSEAELFVYNPTRVLDSLDEEASELDRFSDGKIMWIWRYAFRSKSIADVDIFKIPNLRVSPTFVSKRVMQSWRSAGLRGLEFKKIWSG